ncbi:MAG: hypothetical protein AAFR17_06395 [Pseudomonadota bacterium]
MDDVLASIRRIIRSDKGPAAEAASPAKPSSPGPQSPPPSPARNPAVEVAAADSASEPLTLTPDMMVGGSSTDPAPTSAQPSMPSPPKPAQDLPPRAPEPAATVAPLQPAQPASAMPAIAEPQQASAPLVLDEAAVEGMVRRVLHEELMGQIGQNISANVQRMIEAEIAKHVKSGGK